MKRACWIFLLAALVWFSPGLWAEAPTVVANSAGEIFPLPTEVYGDATETHLMAKLANRARREPLNVVATVIFFLAILHTFLAPKIMHWSHLIRDRHLEQMEREGRAVARHSQDGAVSEVSFAAQALHFLGEIEAVFGVWVLPLLLALIFVKDWQVAEKYLTETVHFTEPLFVVIIMTIAATRPVLLTSEQAMLWVSDRLGGSAAAIWFSVLTLGSLLGSLITEPAAMTISALVLARQIYERKPSPALAYATLGLLFVNVSIGGTLTHFAAPPVLMVAGKWGWSALYMLEHFGWKSVVAILVSNAVYWVWFRREFATLQAPVIEGGESQSWATRKNSVPPWITLVHFAFLAWTVFTAHHPVFFIGGFLFFLAFLSSTEHHQNPVELRSPMLVGFFLAGLVVHGGLQSWWIAPVLESLGPTSLFLGATALTAFNDNAAITYLASLVPSLTESLKYAVVAGAVTGGGLTVIANAPNPAGQSILAKYFNYEIAPLKLLLAALVPTAVAAAVFILLA